MSSAQTPEYRRFLQKLREARMDLEMTQEQVAQKLRVEQSWISKVERGVRRLDVVELAKFAAIFEKLSTKFFDEFEQISNLQ
jgi:transcriptional regulator with XRE-family HTH domain